MIINKVIKQALFNQFVKPENEGKLRDLAAKHGKTSLQMAYYIKAHPDEFDPVWQKRATFAITAITKWKKGKK